jgi:hypothetical protein
MSEDDDVEIEERDDDDGSDIEAAIVVQSASETQLLNMPGPVWLAYQLTMAQALGQAEIPVNILKASHGSLERFVGLSERYCWLIDERLKRAHIDTGKFA